MKKIVQNVKNAIGAEIPLWITSGNSIMQGHADLILVIGDTLYVGDYKPDLSFKGASLSTDFVNSFAQVSSYALMIQKAFGIKKIKCITFNGDGMKIYDPSVIMNEIEASLGTLAPDKLSAWNLFF